ncbi:hypothetical protein B10927_13650 [Campylobacter jejuni]|nr:hypothetical protein B10927_13650 [Campylobacter jejuni]GML73476.1 hypothetical protein B10628_15720 [Campylobacter jejuni]
MTLGFFDGKITLESYENLKREEVLEFAKKNQLRKKKISRLSKIFSRAFRSQFARWTHNPKRCFYK